MMDVAGFASQKNLDERIGSALRICGYDHLLFDKIAGLPVRRSHAVSRLGSYVARGAEPVAIRLQFAQEEKMLIDTFLHELAHCLDHLTNQPGRPYRRAHGAGWRRWAEALQIAPDRCGESEALRQLHTSRLKVVAVCKRCGFELRRVRRLPRRRRYSHVECGGMFRPR